jgi:GNAT superfamily N-acetyltransferase
MIEVRILNSNLIGDIEKLFGSDKVTQGCWCMWFIIRVKDYHDNGSVGNQKLFINMVQDSKDPMGLLAYMDGEPVGWCAIGPRKRYMRAINTSTFKGRDPIEDSLVWMIPCLYVRPDMRNKGVSRTLIERAIELTKENEVKAVESFPFSGTKQRSGGDIQVGVESLFASCGFVVIRQPSNNRVVMRKDLMRAKL